MKENRCMAFIYMKKIILLVLSKRKTSIRGPGHLGHQFEQHLTELAKTRYE